MSIEYPCVYWNDGKCKKFSEDGIVSWCVNGPCGDMRPSNADRIRAMSDEELARAIYFGWDAQYCRNDQKCKELLDTTDSIPEEMCIACAVKWLKQPAEVEE